MTRGLNKSFASLQGDVADLRQKYGTTHFVFIAPFDLPSGVTSRIMSLVIEEGIEDIPEALMEGRRDLDIYFVDRKHKGATMTGDAVLFSRMSISGHP